MTPLAIPLIVMGNYFDARKYGKLDEQDAMARMAYLMANFGDFLLQIDRIFDPMVYDPEDAETALVSSIPFARREGCLVLNAWGDSIRFPQGRQFMSRVTPDPILSALTHRNLWISPPRRESTTLFGEPTTDAQFYEFINHIGQNLKSELGRPKLNELLLNSKVDDATAKKLFETLRDGAALKARVALYAAHRGAKS